MPHKEKPMHWRLQKIRHGLSHLKHALTDKYAPGHKNLDPGGAKDLAALPGLQLMPMGNNLVKLVDGGRTVFLRETGSDAAVYHEIFVKEEYKALTGFLQLNGIKVGTLVDLGANIGLASRYFIDKFSPQKILCVEPYTPSFEVAAKNLEGFSQVAMLKKAVWDKATVPLHLHRHFRDGQDWAMAVKEKPGSLEAGQAEGITLHDIIRMPGFENIDVLKVDIEGGEQVIFNPNADTSFLQQVKVVCIELHKEVLGCQRIFDTFRKYGFLLFESDGLLIGYRSGRAGAGL